MSIYIYALVFGESVLNDANFEGNNGYLSPDDQEPSSGNKIKMKLQEFQRSAASFTALDKNYPTPFLTSQNGDEEDEGFRILRQVGRVRLKDRHMQVDDYGSVTKLELEVYKLDLTIRVY
ncbi:Sodium/hydrogen exchanger 6 [Glycine soja]